MGMQPQDVHLHDVGTSQGNWGIFVQSVVEAQDNDKLFVRAILEQAVDDEHFRMRTLEMLVFKSDLVDSQHRAEMLSRIRDWIETTDGDGFLDLVSRSD